MNDFVAELLRFFGRGPQPHHHTVSTGRYFWLPEVGVVTLIAGMSGFDALGFYQTMEVVSRTWDSFTTGTLVAALTVVTVAIPTMAAVFKKPVIGGLLWLTWAVIGAIIFMTRLGGSAPAVVSDKALGSVPTTTVHNYVVPSLFGMVYVATGLIAYLHAAKVSSEIGARMALRTQRRITELEKELAVWKEAETQATTEESKLDGILNLDKQANITRERVAREMARIEMIRQLGDPAAAERIISNSRGES